MSPNSYFEMIPYLLVSNNLDQIKSKVEEILDQNNLTLSHPNLLLFEPDQKLGVEQAKKIRSHLSQKPYQGEHQAVVILSADEMTTEAQNSLLKTLEEPPGQALIILAVKSVDHLLPTLVSRCQVTYSEGGAGSREVGEKQLKQVEQLEKGTIEERFVLIDKTEDREELLPALTYYFRQKLINQPNNPKLINFMEDLLTAQKWSDQNVTIRAILEFLMFKMP